MSEIKDGGPAFPVQSAEWQGHGMSLRDYFAAKAMHAELMTCCVPGEAAEALVEAIEQTGERPEQHMARVAYEMADAMIAARETRS